MESWYSGKGFGDNSEKENSVCKWKNQLVKQGTRWWKPIIMSVRLQICWDGDTTRWAEWLDREFEKNHWVSEERIWWIKWEREPDYVREWVRNAWSGWGIRRDKFDKRNGYNSSESGNWLELVWRFGMLGKLEYNQPWRGFLRRRRIQVKLIKMK